jgi:hypothetical protein
VLWTEPVSDLEGLPDLFTYVPALPMTPILIFSCVETLYFAGEGVQAKIVFEVITNLGVVEKSILTFYLVESLYFGPRERHYTDNLHYDTKKQKNYTKNATTTDLKTKMIKIVVTAVTVGRRPIT